MTFSRTLSINLVWFVPLLPVAFSSLFPDVPLLSRHTVRYTLSPLFLLFNLTLLSFLTVDLYTHTCTHSRAHTHTHTLARAHTPPLIASQPRVPQTLLLTFVFPLVCFTDSQWRSLKIKQA